MTWLRELLSCGLLLLAGCDRASSLRYDEPAQRTSTIAYLRSLCPSAGARILTQEIDLCGVVTANDLYDEFYKTIVIGDASGGIEIAIDRIRLHELFPLNAEVVVHCNGLAVGDYGGKAVLGAPPTGDYSVDRIPVSDLNRFVRVTNPNCGRRRDEVRTLADLSVQDAGRYLRFEEVRFAVPGVPWCATDEETRRPLPTEHTLCDQTGRTLAVRVPAGCFYATEPVPRGTGSVNGILDYFNGRFALRIANREFDFPIYATPPTAYPSVAGY